jgi:hypothetical protein
MAAMASSGTDSRGDPAGMCPKVCLHQGCGRTPITSLQYFSDIIKKVTELAIPEGYSALLLETSCP